MSRRRVSVLRAARLEREPRLSTQSTIDDPLDQLEANKERTLIVRSLWLINRDLVNRERLPVSSHSNAQGHQRWRDAFMALRVMELAGEVFGSLSLTPRPRNLPPWAQSMPWALICHLPVFCWPPPTQ